MTSINERSQSFTLSKTPRGGVTRPMTEIYIGTGKGKGSNLTVQSNNKRRQDVGVGSMAPMPSIPRAEKKVIAKKIDGMARIAVKSRMKK